MPLTIGLIGAGAGVAGGLIGNAASQDDRDAAMAARKAALAQMAGVQLPSIDQQRVNAAKEEVQGELSPQMEAAINAQQSAMNGIKISPQIMAAQQGALASLQQQGSQGLSASDRNALININNSANQQNQGRQAAIMQNMAARGQLGSGNELAARMIANQNATVNAQQQGQNLASAANQNALQAIAAGGNLAGNMNNQSFGQQQATASANDIINRFNTQNQQSVANQNVAAGNQAQAANLANKQNVANANTGIQNQQNYYNSGLYQQQFNDAMQRAGGIAAQQNNVGNANMANAQATSNMWGQIGSGVAGGAAAYGGYKAPAQTLAQQDAAARANTASNDFMGPQQPA